MMRNGKKGVGYPRVSGAIQGDGTSLDTQAAAMVDLATSLGYEIAPEDMLPEVGSGVNLERPQLDKIRRMATARDFDALFVYTTDRLSRDPLDLLMLIREFDRQGVTVHFVQDSSDNSPEGELVKFVLGYSAGREHAQIRERTMRGRLAVARAGRMPVGSLSGIYGYDYSKATKARTVNTEEAKVVKRIFRLFTNGWSMSGIAGQLVVMIAKGGAMVNTSVVLDSVAAPGFERGKPWERLLVGPVIIAGFVATGTRMACR